MMEAITDMPINIKGKDRTDIHKRLSDIVFSFEKQGHFDYQMTVQGTDDGGWLGRLDIEFHKRAYPSDYQRKELLPCLPNGNNTKRR